MQSAVTPPAEPPSTEYDPYSTSFSRETFDSTISNHRNSLLASQLEPHWSPDTLSACEICNKSFSFRYNPYRTLLPYLLVLTMMYKGGDAITAENAGC